MYGYVGNGDASSVHGSMNSHTLYQQNFLRSLINSNNSDDIDINAELNNSDVSCRIGIIIIHTLSQCN